MTFYIYAFCALVGVPWAPFAEWYNFYENGEYVLTLEEGSFEYPKGPYEPEGYYTEVCRVDYYTDVVYQYIAADEFGESALSQTLTVQWVHDFDRDDNGFVGFADFGAFAVVYGSDHPTDLWADADENGSVGFGDFGAFVQRYGRCNNGKYEIDCG